MLFRLRSSACLLLPLVVLAFACGPRAAVGGPPSPPFWGGNNPIYTVSVNLTNPQPVAYWTLQYYYNGLTNASRYEHSPPQFDEMCQGQPYGSDYRCDVLFAEDGWSYIIFPTVVPASCCQCENSFGSTLWTWLQDNATFVGVVDVNGVQTQQWDKWGNELNHYFVTDDDEQAAVRYSEMWSPGEDAKDESPAAALKEWDFDRASLRTGNGSFDPQKLVPPTVCPLCTNPMCIALRLPNNTQAIKEQD